MAGDRAAGHRVCLQETKCATGALPRPIFSGLGHEAGVRLPGPEPGTGSRSWSRVGLTDIRDNPTDQPEWEGKLEPRAIAATCGGAGVSLYIPNGRDSGTRHYQYKLRWLKPWRTRQPKN